MERKVFKNVRRAYQHMQRLRKIGSQMGGDSWIVEPMGFLEKFSDGRVAVNNILCRMHSDGRIDATGDPTELYDKEHTWHGHPDGNFGFETYGTGFFNSLEDGNPNKPSLTDLSTVLQTPRKTETIAVPEGIFVVSKETSVTEYLARGLAQVESAVGEFEAKKQMQLVTAALMKEFNIDEYNASTWRDVADVLGLGSRFYPSREVSGLFRKLGDGDPRRPSSETTSRSLEYLSSGRADAEARRIYQQFQSEVIQKVEKGDSQ